MSVTSLKNIEHIRQQASEWIVRMDGAELIKEEQDALVDWLAESVTHRQTFLELAELWGMMESLSPLSELIPLADTEGEQLNVAINKIQEWRRVLIWRVVAGVAAVFLVFFAGLFSLEQFSFRDSDNKEYITALGVQEYVTLSDGSSIRMNTNTKISVNYSQTERQITLVYGEAHFEVTHNAHRPFVVHVGEGTVKAIGTAFNIFYIDGETDVLVTEGSVEFVPLVLTQIKPESDTQHLHKEEKPLIKTILSSGEAVVLQKEGYSVQRLENEDINKKLAWQWNMLIFNGESLEDVIKEISRYTATKIIINDPYVRELSVGGYFRSDQVESILDTLALSLDIQVTKVDKGVLLLSKNTEAVQQTHY